MPSSDHVDHAIRQQSEGGEEKKSSKGSTTRGRRGIPIDIDDTSIPIISPLLSRFPSLSGISSFKGFLPTSPSKSSGSHPTDVKAVWQEADFGNGRGKVPLLLITSGTHALQIFTLPDNAIPDDPHVQETYPAPEEVFSILKIKYDGAVVRSALPGVLVPKGASSNGEQVLGARLLEMSASWEEYGTLAALVTLTTANRKASQNGALALVLLSLRTGLAIKRLELGQGKAAAVTSSASVIAVSISHPVPTIHLLDPVTLSPSHTPIMDLPVNNLTNLPILAMSGRLLAYITPEAPHTIGPDGLGSLITAKSCNRFRSSASSGSTMTNPQVPFTAVDTTAQGALLDSAVEIGGGVARGVWEGIKMGARAAGKARNGRLARSAPAERSASLVDDEERDESGDSEARSLDDSSLIDDALAAAGPSSSGDWIKVIDLFPRIVKQGDRTAVVQVETTGRSPPAMSATKTKVPPVTECETVAHFRLPAARTLQPSYPVEISHGSRRVSDFRSQPASLLSFSPLGTQLFAAPRDGRAFHIFDLHPAGAVKDSLRGDCKGEIWHLYELRRGTTSASVCEVSWDRTGRWIGVGTSRGTIHIFPITPSGGLPSAATHANLEVTNPTKLPPLSTVITPLARLRPRFSAANGQTEESSVSLPFKAPGVFAFTRHRRDPLSKDLFCQDVAIFRPLVAQVEVARLSSRAVIPERPSRSDYSNAKRGSALTEMMRDRAGLADRTDLSVGHAIKACWVVPLGGGGAEPMVKVPQAKMQRSVSTARHTRSLARAEIQTHSTNNCILPNSIYLSHQVDFFSAKATDEYSPLSMLDLEARTHRLVFRHEVEARSASPEVKSFDKPLLSALHSVLESPSPSQIPGLPNGYPARNKWRSSVPIRHVAAGLGEGVDRVRREYARAQHTRLRRRASEAAANQLSFEEDAVFASGDEGSSPSSGVLPESSVAGEDQEDGNSDEWGEGWEEEYRRAVEDDGGPDDLVLGLLDEEEEERRKWESRQVLARQHAKD